MYGLTKLKLYVTTHLYSCLSSSGLQDTSLMPSHYPTLYPWYYPCLQLKVRNIRK